MTEEITLSRYQNFKPRYNTSIKKYYPSIPLSIPDLVTQWNLHTVLVQKQLLNISNTFVIM